MVILRGLSIKRYIALKNVFKAIDDNKTQMIDTRGDEPLIDVELPDDVIITHNGDNTLLYSGLSPYNTMVFMTKNAYEYIEIK